MQRGLIMSASDSYIGLSAPGQKILEMNTDPDRVYTEKAALVNVAAAKMADYLNRVDAAYKFAEGAKENTEQWDGLFLMGLAMSNLELTPVETQISVEPYWNTIPASPNNTWGDSIIVPPLY